MARNSEDHEQVHEKDQKRPGRRRRAFGLIVASAVATAPLGCDDTTSKPLVVSMDAGTSQDATNMDDATAAPDGDTDAGGAVDAAQDYPSGVRG
jgi:hypothetical protein